MMTGYQRKVELATLLSNVAKRMRMHSNDRVKEPFVGGPDGAVLN